MALVPSNLTLTVFDWSELVGHLPIYGVLAVLLLWGSGKDLPLWLAGLRGGPPRAPANADGGRATEPRRAATERWPRSGNRA